METVWLAVMHVWRMFIGGSVDASTALQSDGVTPVLASATYTGLLPEAWDFTLSFEPLLFGLALVVIGLVAFVGTKMVGVVKGMFA